MILHSVRAANVLKYARLDLAELPETGIIAISGANESGKTAVVETICFALFGRTFSLAPEDISKCIRWGEDQCFVELEFSRQPGERYRVVRTLSAEGVQGATLFRVGEPEPRAAGVAAVQAALTRLAGFSFEQYLDSLYRAQREISAPQSQADTIKAVAGGVRLEEVAAELELEAMEERRAIKAIEREAEALHAQANALANWEDGIAVLERDKAEILGRIRGNDEGMVRLQESSDALTRGCEDLLAVGREVLDGSVSLSYRQWRDFRRRMTEALAVITGTCAQLETDHGFCTGDDVKGFVWELEGRLDALDQVRQRARNLRAGLAEQLADVARGEDGLPGASLVYQQRAVGRSLQVARGRRGLVWVVFSLLLLVLAVVLAAWMLLERFPATEAGAFLAQWLAAQAWWQEPYRNHLLPATGVTGVLVLGFGYLAWGASRRVRSIQTRHGDLGRRLEVARHRADLIDHMDGMALHQALDALEDLGDERVRAAVVDFREGPGAPLVDPHRLTEMQQRLYQVLQGCDAQLRDVRETIAAASGGLDKDSEQQRDALAACERAIAAEHDKGREAQALEAQIQETRGRIPAHAERVRELELAQRLVRGTCQSLYRRFNRVLRRYTGEVMPRLTDQRYRHLQIDDDLAVRVFSDDKNDFATLEELSSGTQRQVMLAVRLAMAKALAEAAVGGRQFLVLDEPFAFFDRERVRGTLAALPTLDPLLSQIFIIAQEFDPQVEFALSLHCERGRDRLAAPGAG